MAVAAPELCKLVKAAVEAAKQAEEGDAAEQGRAVDALKVLQRQLVTAALLKDTEAGKKVNKLAKHSDAAIASAAGGVVAAWKDCVRKEASKQGSQAESGGSGLGRSSSQASVGFGPSSQAGAAGIARTWSGATASAPHLGGDAPTPPSSGKPRPAAASNGAAGGAGPRGGPGAGASCKVPPCGDPKRDKVRQVFADALAVALGEGCDEGSPVDVAIAVETEVHSHAGGTSAAYAAKVRTLSFNLKDASNPDLRARVLRGAITPQQLVLLSAEELASDALRAEKEAMRERATWESVRGQAATASTDMFTCAKCKQTKCTYYQLQTRSADEPMTTFVQCTVCNNRWRFC